ncbi:MAG: hypothetical protein HY820_03785 [Acidobacteria bacterium]|nr:hypothetical protein [Acidobacteriota bacterium]
MTSAGTNIRHVLLHKLAAFVLLLLGPSGFLAATLIRIAPGFGFDEQSLDLRWTEESRARLERVNEQGALAFYAAYLSGVARGELGQSLSTSTPVAQLLRERIPLTAALVGESLVAAWVLALTAAVVMTRWRLRPCCFRSC